MGPLLVLSILALVLGAFAITASGLGVDSRDLSDDPHRASFPVGIG